MDKSFLKKVFGSSLETKEVLLVLYLAVALLSLIVGIGANMIKAMLIINGIFLVLIPLGYGFSRVVDYIRQQQTVILPFLKKIGLIPSVTESSAYVMALTATILILTNSDVTSELLFVITSAEEGEFISIFIYILIGMATSFYHAFSRKPKTEFSIFILKWYTAVTLALLAISTAVYTYIESTFYFLPLVVWNVIQACILLIIADSPQSREYIHLHDRHATLIEVCIATMVVLIVLAAETLVDTHWSIAFSSVLFVWYIVGEFFNIEKTQVTPTPFNPNRSI